MLHYGYFVLLQNGRLVGAGNDWGPTPDTYKTGDSLGVKDGSEGTVAGVVKGAAAKRHGVDEMCIRDREQLGLKLESAKGPVEILIIDHVETPSEN